LLSFPSLKRPIRQLVRDAVEHRVPPLIVAVLGDLGLLPLGRVQGRQDFFSICPLWFSFYYFDSSRFRGFTKLVFCSKVNL
jgi:hypothetical protein